MSENGERLSSLSVLGGVLHGKTFQLSKEPEEITIGSAPSCRFRLEAPGIAPLHARIVADETGAALYDLQSPRGTFLNFERVEGRVTLSDGDMIRLGPPQERDSVMVQLEFGGALADAPAPSPAPSGPARAPEAPPAAAPSFGTTSDDEALIADLTSGDDQAFVISDEPTSLGTTTPSPSPVVPPAAPKVPAVPAPAPPPVVAPSAPAPPVVPAPPPVVVPAPVVAPPPAAPPPPAPVALAPEAPAVEAIPADEFFVAADPEPETPAYAPPAPESSGTPLGSAPYTGDEGEFALPAFDPNWGRRRPRLLRRHPARPTSSS